MEPQCSSLESGVQSLQVSPETLPLRIENAGSDLFSRQRGNYGARPSNDRPSTSPCVYRPDRPASLTIRDGFVPGSFPHAAQQRSPSRWMRSWQAMRSTQSRGSSLPMRASVLFVARSNGWSDGRADAS